MGILTDVVTISPTLYYGTPNPKKKTKLNGREMSRLITAAVVNKSFCQMLLNNPRKALASGYQGESFTLDAKEKELVFSIQAASLPEFARQISKHTSNNGSRNGNRYLGRV